MGDTWFRPKSFGYGATPVSWQGWALTLGSSLVVAAFVVTGILAVRRHWPFAVPVATLCGFIGVATLAISVAVSRRKTDGVWRWRP